MAIRLFAEIDSFRKWLIGRGLAPRTVSDYGKRIQEMVTYLEEVGVETVDDVTAEVIPVIETWLSEKVNRRGDPISSQSRKNFVVTFRSFSEYLALHDLILFDVGRKLKLPRKRRTDRQVPSRQEMKNFIDSIPVDDWFGPRQKLLVQLLYYTGIRIGEAARIRVDEVDMSRRRIFIRGKGGHERYVYFPPRMVTPLSRYLSMHRGDNPDLLFNCRDPGNLIGVVTELARRHGMKQTGCHWIRYTSATHLFEAGANPRVIQVLFGHKSLRSTMEYIRPGIDYLREIHLKYHPFQRGFL